MLRKTIYAQFCAGETLKDVRITLSGLKGIGYKGVILAHAKEIVLESGGNLTGEEKYDELAAGTDVEIWKQSNLETLSMVEEGDFIAVKYGSCIACPSSFESAYPVHLSDFPEQGHMLCSNLLKAYNQAKGLTMQ